MVRKDLGGGFPGGGAGAGDDEFAIGTASRKTPGLGIPTPSGLRMVMMLAALGRTSIVAEGG